MNLSHGKFLVVFLCHLIRLSSSQFLHIDESLYAEKECTPNIDLSPSKKPSSFPPMPEPGNFFNKQIELRQFLEDVTPDIARLNESVGPNETKLKNGSNVKRTVVTHGDMEHIQKIHSDLKTWKSILGNAFQVSLYHGVHSNKQYSSVQAVDALQRLIPQFPEKMMIKDGIIHTSTQTWLTGRNAVFNANNVEGSTSGTVICLTVTSQPIIPTLLRICHGDNFDDGYPATVIYTTMVQNYLKVYYKCYADEDELQLYEICFTDLDQNGQRLEKFPTDLNIPFDFQSVTSDATMECFLDQNFNPENEVYQGVRNIENSLTPDAYKIQRHRSIQKQKRYFPDIKLEVTGRYMCKLGCPIPDINEYVGSGFGNFQHRTATMWSFVRLLVTVSTYYELHSRQYVGRTYFLKYTAADNVEFTLPLDYHSMISGNNKPSANPHPDETDHVDYQDVDVEENFNSDEDTSSETSDTEESYLTANMHFDPEHDNRPAGDGFTHQRDQLPSGSAIPPNSILPTNDNDNDNSISKHADLQSRPTSVQNSSVDNANETTVAQAAFTDV